MTGQQFVTLTFASGVLSAAVALALATRSRGYSRAVKLPLLALAGFGCLWAFAYGLQLNATELEWKLFWLRFAALGSVPGPTAWLLFVLAYTGHESALTRRRVAVLAAVPVAVLAVVFAPSLSGFYFANVGLWETQGLHLLQFSPGPVYTGFAAYVVLLGAVGFALLFRQFLGSTGIQRQQVALLLAAATPPLVTATTFAAGAVPFDPSPVAIGVSNLLVFAGLRRYGLLDVTPLARDTVFEELTDGMVIVDEADCVIEANPVAECALSLPADYANEPAAAVLPAGEAVQEVLAGERATAKVSVDGGEGLRHFEVSATGLVAGARGGAVLSFRDVTDQTTVEQQHRALIENARDVITVVDADDTHRYVSPAIERTVGYEVEELLGGDIFEVVHPADHDVLRQVFDQLAPGASTRVDYRVRTDTGQYRSFDGIVVNLLDDPAVEGFVINSRDVTEHRRYEQRLRVLNRVLRHDLRNEMNVVVGYADLLLETELTDEQAAFAETIRTKGETVVDLGEQTREVVETLGSGNRKSVVDVAAVVHRQAHEARGRFPEATITVHVPERPVRARAGRLLGDALSRIVENAVEHNDRPAPRVEIAVEVRETTDGETVTIRVADDGPGIPERERTAIADGVETPLEHLSGIDLWLVSWYAEGVDGELTLSENEPRGAVVSVTLAAADQSAPKNTARAPADD